jgi:hypothetical protein
MRRAGLLPAVVFALVPLPGFHSPSGNIRCYAEPGGGAPVLRCEIGQAGYARTLQARCLRPDGSGVDWHGFELGAANRGQVTCSGGILYDTSRYRLSFANLPYGRTWRHRPFSCVSRITGVTCRNARGHGLFISRASWRAW